MANTETATMSLSEMVSMRDGAAYLWSDAQRRFAKIIRDGVTIARIDCFVDGSFEVSSDGRRSTVPTWEAASAWLTARVVAEALTSAIWIPA